MATMSPLLYDPQNHPVIGGGYMMETTDTPPFFNERSWDYIPYINWKEVFKKDQNVSKIFFIAYNNREEDEAYSVLSGFMEEHRIGRLSIFEWPLKTANHEREYKKFLTRLIKKTSLKNKAALYETFLYYACKNKNESQFVRLLKEYRALEPFLDEFITDEKLPSRFVLRRRAKYFENGVFCNKKD